MCSYADQKRGFAGGAADGALTLAVDGGSLFHCRILIHEPAFGWAKMREMASYSEELRVSINAQPCEAPTCSVCRRQALHVRLETAPLSDEAFAAKRTCGSMRNGNCEGVGV